MAEFFNQMMLDLGFVPGSNLTVDHVIILIVFLSCLEFLSTLVSSIIGRLNK